LINGSLLQHSPEFHRAGFTGVRDVLLSDLPSGLEREILTTA
jgi:hypothetical protein